MASIWKTVNSINDNKSVVKSSISRQIKVEMKSFQNQDKKWKDMMFGKISNLFLLKTESSSEPAFTCSKLTIKTLEQGVKYVQS